MVYKLGILAATTCDCKMGARYFQINGIEQIVSYALSDSPEAQTALQKKREELLLATIRGIDFLIQNNVRCVVIYCNSLSSALNLSLLRKKYSIPIITPVDIYNNLANDYSIFGVFAANCQAVYNLERIIMKANPNALVIAGLANLAIVQAIERNMPARTIIADFCLLESMQSFAMSNCPAVIVGCTHFNYFLPNLCDQLKQINYKPKIIEPSVRMLHMVKAIFNIKG